MAEQLLALDSLKLVQRLKDKSSEFYGIIRDVYTKTESLLNTRIAQVFPKYTLHNDQHSFRIIRCMASIVPDVDGLSDLDVAVLILSALLHDIGMAASDHEIAAIKSSQLVYHGMQYKALLDKFSGDETEAVQDYIRRVHAERSAEYIRRELCDELRLKSMPNTSLCDVVAAVCQSHTENCSWTEKHLPDYQQKGEYDCNPRFCAVVLRLGDILDFDSQRTPPVLFDALRLSGYSEAEWRQHFAIENTNKIRRDEALDQKMVEFFGTCADSYIHRKILGYFDWINRELANAVRLTRNMPPQYLLKFAVQVSDNIRSEGYAFADLRFKVDFKQVTKLLMGEQIYGSRKMGLRELVQNAMDACKLRKEIEDRHRNPWDDEYKPSIKIVLNPDSNQVIIQDNGVGMTFETLNSHFLNVGSSYYGSDDFVLNGFKHIPIGNYGIGFLACFMLSDKVVVKTGHFQGTTGYTVELAKFDEYVCIKDNCDLGITGTQIILDYQMFMSAFEDDTDQLKLFCSLQFLTDDVEIEITVVTDRADRLLIDNRVVSADTDALKERTVYLDRYLDGVEGEVLLNTMNVSQVFRKGFGELPVYGKVYVDRGGRIARWDQAEGDLFAEFMDNDDLRIVEIPLIDDAEDYRKRLEIYEDVESAVDSYVDAHSSEHLSVVVTSDTFSRVQIGDKFQKDEIFPGFLFEHLNPYGHNRHCDTYIAKEIVKIYKDPDRDKYLWLDELQSRGFASYPYNPFSYRMYVRSILVKRFAPSFHHAIEGIRLDNLLINVTHKEVVPNVARNDLPEEMNKEIASAIYQAVCLALLERTKDLEEREVLSGYMKKYHSRRNRFLKEAYRQYFE